MPKSRTADDALALQILERNFSKECSHRRLESDEDFFRQDDPITATYVHILIQSGTIKQK